MHVTCALCSCSWIMTSSCLLVSSLDLSLWLVASAFSYIYKIPTHSLDLTFKISKRIFFLCNLQHTKDHWHCGSFNSVLKTIFIIYRSTDYTHWLFWPNQQLKNMRSQKRYPAFLIGYGLMLIVLWIYKSSSQLWYSCNILLCSVILKLLYWKCSML